MSLNLDCYKLHQNNPVICKHGFSSVIQKKGSKKHSTEDNVAVSVLPQSFPKLLLLAYT